MRITILIPKKFMQFMIDDTDFAKTIGDNARSYVIKNHSLNIWVKKVIGGV